MIRKGKLSIRRDESTDRQSSDGDTSENQFAALLEEGEGSDEDFLHSLGCGRGRG